MPYIGIVVNENLINMLNELMNKFLPKVFQKNLKIIKANIEVL